MKRAYRLTNNAEFQRVRATSRSWAHPLVMLFAAPNDLGRTRLGISVSKRVGTAVVRNRVRRRIREVVRLQSGQLAPGYDLVFVARPPSATAGWPEIRGAVEDVLHRARLLSSTGPNTKANENL